jgi:hypothetical protein
VTEWTPVAPEDRARLIASLKEEHPQCTARKDFPPQEGERCSMLPHAEWMPHSWIPWSMALEMQKKNRAAARRPPDYSWATATSAEIIEDIRAHMPTRVAEAPPEA